MIKSLFTKLFNSKGSNPNVFEEAVSATIDRGSLGRDKVGIPQMEFIDEFMTVTDEHLNDNARRDVIKYYMEGMMFSHLLSLIDKGLSDRALQDLNPDEVKFLHLVLMRDHLRHNADCINPGIDENWIDAICVPLLDNLNISDERKNGFPEKFNLDDIQADWAKRLSSPFGMEGFRLAVTHSAIVTGPKDEGLCC